MDKLTIKYFSCGALRFTDVESDTAEEICDGLNSLKQCSDAEILGSSTTVNRTLYY